jgi:CheY-like chemotaxis protein
MMKKKVYFSCIPGFFRACSTPANSARALPFKPVAADRMQRLRSQMATDKPQRTFSLLIVEDDKEACEVMTRMVTLRFPACTIHRADNGVQGIELFKEHFPDIVLTDVNMPVMDGIELLRAIRAIKADASCIVLTAYSDKIVFQKFKDLGVSAYLLKPLDFNELFVALGKCSDLIPPQTDAPEELPGGSARPE